MARSQTRFSFSDSKSDALWKTDWIWLFFQNNAFQESMEKPTLTFLRWKLTQETDFSTAIFRTNLDCVEKIFSSKQNVFSQKHLSQNHIFRILIQISTNCKKLAQSLTCSNLLDAKTDALYKNWFKNWFFSKVLIHKIFSPENIYLRINFWKKLEIDKLSMFSRQKPSTGKKFGTRVSQLTFF